MKAIWNSEIIAESSDTIVVDNNHYFPKTSLNMSFFSPSETTTVCGWKGLANYYDVVVNDQVNAGAAWYYAQPKDAAKNIAGYVAFWKGVEVTA